MKLTVKDILLSLWQSIYLIIISCIVGMLVLGGVTYLFIEPEYTATAKLYVYNEKSDERYITSSDLTVSKSLVDTYLVIVKSTPVLEEAAQELQDRYPGITASQISKMLVGSAINETEAFYISATDVNRQKATDVVNKVIEIVPDEIIRIVKAASVEIIEEAKLPAKDNYQWPLVRNIIIGFAIGFVLSVAYILAANSLDTTVYGRNEIASNFKVPILGAIPTQIYRGQIYKKSFMKKNPTLGDEGIRQSFILNDSTSFAVAEAYRMARTNIFYIPMESTCKKIAITSAIASEGKSICSINLAKLLYSAGKRVLLIDGDMRKPRIARYVGIDRRQTGFSEYLAGITDQVNILKNTSIGADILLSGNTSTSAAELLATPRTDALLSTFSPMYDYIIIDTPPINVVTDATVLSNKVDGYIMSVRAGYSDVNEIKQMLSSLEQLDAKVLGIIVSDIDPKSEQYGRYSRYGRYGKYYKRYGYKNYSGYNKYYYHYYSSSDSIYGENAEGIKKKK